ncbi:MAG: thiamine pyrophosphate-binding protein, partial [Pseudomonadota bacterium]
MSTLSVGEALIAALEDLGVDTVFGIPGVHTVELYRGLAGSAVRHVTPRHEQGAALMADGYARVTGRPGVCLLITGPGFTNAITAIAQARADSVPMLILSGVNPVETRGRHLGLLHELPDQAALSRTVCLKTWTLTDPEALGD